MLWTYGVRQGKVCTLKKRASKYLVSMLESRPNTIGSGPAQVGATKAIASGFTRPFFAAWATIVCKDLIMVLNITKLGPSQVSNTKLLLKWVLQRNLPHGFNYSHIQNGKKTKKHKNLPCYIYRTIWKALQKQSHVQNSKTVEAQNRTSWNNNTLLR